MVPRRARCMANVKTASGVESSRFYEPKVSYQATADLVRESGTKDLFKVAAKLKANGNELKKENKELLKKLDITKVEHFC